MMHTGWQINTKVKKNLTSEIEAGIKVSKLTSESKLSHLSMDFLKLWKIFKGRRKYEVNKNTLAEK